MSLRLAHIGRDEARDFCRAVHRHHRPPLGAILHLGCWQDWEAPACGVFSILLGIAIVGRPVSRVEQAGGAWEITRVAVVEGAPNVCSALYGYARRVAHLLNPGAVIREGAAWFRRSKTITYTLPEEGGASLRGAGWRPDGLVRGRDWQDCARREAQPKLFEAPPLAPTSDKVRWRAR